MRYLRSSIGAKQVMAVAGLALCCFLITHLAGNFLLLKGATTFNGYAKMLTTNPFIIPAELGLLAVLLVHFAAAVKLVITNYRAKPEGYAVSYQEPRFWPSSLMIVTAVTVVAFLVVHLWTLKYDSRSGQDLFLVVVDRFSNGFYAGFYVFCMIALGVHLFHGFQSAFMTLGIDHPGYTPAIKWLGGIYAVAMAAGYIFLTFYLYFNQGGMR